MAAIRFAEEFANRYGQPHPQFFPGSLDDAIRESCNQPAKDVSYHSSIENDLKVMNCTITHWMKLNDNNFIFEFRWIRGSFRNLCNSQKYRLLHAVNLCFLKHL